MLKRLRKTVRKDSPMYKIWHIFGGIAMNAWVWSIVFHTRDFELTELLDYTFAYSMVLATLWVTILRVFHRNSLTFKLIVSLIAIFYFLNHFAYLSAKRFDYLYNMKANILTGVMSTAIWIIWYFVNRKKKNYAWKIVLFVVLTFASLLLELKDFPPVFWTFDAHSLWHLTTVPLTILFYSFVIDDCQWLRKEKMENQDVEKVDLIDDKEPMSEKVAKNETKKKK